MRLGDRRSLPPAVLQDHPTKEEHDDEIDCICADSSFEPEEDRKE